MVRFPFRFGPRSGSGQCPDANQRSSTNFFLSHYWLHASADAIRHTSRMNFRNAICGLRMRIYVLIRSYRLERINRYIACITLFDPMRVCMTYRSNMIRYAAT